MGRLLLIIACVLTIFDAFGQGCSIGEEIVIQPLETTDIILSLENLLNEDLGSDQGVCGVRMVFEHSQLENLRITLTSPAGQEVVLVGPGVVNSGLTDLITWNVGFTSCSNPAAPDTGFSTTWDNGQAWQSFQTYTGIYHPAFGCLEDFNSGSANGNWLISIENLGPAEGTLFYFELILCNDSGNDCSSCYLDIGEFNSDFEIFCEEDVRLADSGSLLAVDTILGADQSLAYIVSEDDLLLSFDSLPPDLTSLPPGIYTVCGLAYTEEDSTLIRSTPTISGIRTLIDNRLICADITRSCLELRILEADNELQIDTMICRGDTINVRGIEVWDALDTIVTVFDTLQGPMPGIMCDSVIYINVVVSDITAAINATDTTVNCGKSVFLNASGSMSQPVPVTDFSWTTSDGVLINNFGPIAGIAAGGNYTLTVHNGVCRDSISIRIHESSAFETDLLPEPRACAGDAFIVNIVSAETPDSVQLTGPPFTGLNSNAFATGETGTYILDSYFGNCRDRDTIVLTEDLPVLELQVETDTIDCIRNEVPLNILTNVINPVIEITGPENISGNDLDPVVSTPGIYTIDITDARGCMISAQIEVADDRDDPSFEVSDVTRPCRDASVTLPLVLNSQVDTLSWTFPDGSMTDATNPPATEEGMYALYLAGPNGCSTDTTIHLTVQNEEPEFTLTGAHIDCETDRVELCAEGELMSAGFIWSRDGIQVSNDSCFETGTAGLYALSITTQTGCTASDSLWVEDLRFEPGLNIDASGTFINCSNEIINLAGSVDTDPGGLEYVWTLNDGTEVMHSDISVSEGGWFFLEVRDGQSGCRERDSILIVQFPDMLQEVEVQSYDPVCDENTGSIQIMNLPDGEDYDIFINNQQVFDLLSLESVPPDNYLIEIINSEGCIFDTNVVINDPMPLSVDIGDDIFGTLGQQFDLNVDLSIPLDHLDSIHWSDPGILSCTDCTNPTLTITENQLLSILVTDLTGCTATDELNIRVDTNFELFIPNVFTPNGDGNNDKLILFLSESVVKIFDIRITDRWGNLLFFHPEITNEVNNFSWDGTFDGFQVGSGVYVFMAKLLLIDGSETVLVEDITLLR